MYIVPIAWLYVALMMAVAEATGTNGTVLGAVVTFVLYGLGPVTLVVYLMGSPARKRAIRAREAKEVQQARAASEPSDPPDAGGQAPAAAQRDAVAPVGKEP